jgi:hypothetical protein
MNKTRVGGKMHTASVLALLACLLPIPVTAEDWQDVQYGKYLCVTDRAVGFQTPPNSSQRYAGVIEMSTDRQKFFATIKKIEVVPLTGVKNWVQDGIIQHVPERCFSQENVQKLENQWKHGGMNYLAPNVEDSINGALPGVRFSCRLLLA